MVECGRFFVLISKLELCKPNIDMCIFSHDASDSKHKHAQLCIGINGK